MDRAEIIHQNFLDKVINGNLPKVDARPAPAEAGLSDDEAVDIFRSQVLSRQLDRISRKMQARGEGFYTIGSSGHEGNAAIAAAFRLEDMAFLHYRDAAFMIQRSKKLDGQTPALDMLLGFAASSDDPISGGRHKVLGSKALNIPPQTSTIASHLPKAVGAAFSIPLARRLKPQQRQLADDSVILCSFGDASLNHSTAQGALNCASWTAFQNSPLPLVFICEDNGIGISTKTPMGWVEMNMRARPGLEYLSCNGLDFLDTYQAATRAERIARKLKKPVFLHMKCVRLYGHAGADMQTAYLSQAEVDAAEADDPLLHSAAILLHHQILDRQEVLDIYQQNAEETEQLARQVAKRPTLTSAKKVMVSLTPPSLKIATPNGPSKSERKTLFGRDLAAMEQPQHMARLINWALADLMLEHKSIILAGEDIGPKGGVYNVTAKLHQRFGADRVINTLLDEQSILGLAIGLAHNGFLPIPEIQFLAYLHNAEDQLRGEAATLSFFSNGQFTNPMVIRIAGLGYQRGFGGHFHNDNSLAVLRDIPGIVIACPSNGEDAVMMLRECVRLAQHEQRVVVFVEPIARYMTRDLYQEKDGLWTALYPAPDRGKTIGVGEIGFHGEGRDLAIITYGNGLYLSRQAEQVLRNDHGKDIRIIDLRWLAPLNKDAIIASVEPCKNVLIVDECRSTGSQSEALMALIEEQAAGRHRVRRVVAEDSFIPLGKAATVTLPSRDSIIAAAIELIG